MNAAKITELPTETINREEINKINRSHRMVTALTTFIGFAGSILTGVFVAGQFTGELATDVKHLTSSNVQVESQMNQLQNTTTILTAAVAALQANIDSLKVDLRNERQDRIDAERRELDRRWSPTRQ